MTPALAANHRLDLPAHLRVVRPLGQGGTSVVYEGFHERLRLPVAIKVLRVAEGMRAEATHRLIQEAELCARLNNPHVPRIYDVDMLPEGVPYLVMELIRGQGVDSLISAGGVSYEDAVWMLNQLLSALGALHGAGIVHRDIKPENLLMQRQAEGRAMLRLIDFGIAQIRDADFTSPRLTQAGTLVGTPHYIAPEVLKGGTADHRSDLYAAGVTFYEVLTGRAPFDDSSVPAALAAALRDDPFPLREVRPELGVEVEHFIARAMARQPERRFGSAFEMSKALSAISGGVVLPPPVATAPLASLLDDDPWEESRVQFSGVIRRKAKGWSAQLRSPKVLRWVVPLLLLVVALLLVSASREDAPAAGAGASTAPSVAADAPASPSVSSLERVEAAPLPVPTVEPSSAAEAVEPSPSPAPREGGKASPRRADREPTSSKSRADEEATPSDDAPASKRRAPKEPRGFDLDYNPYD